jgi:hypothetical protein
MVTQTVRNTGFPRLPDSAQSVRRSILHGMTSGFLVV